jgi:ABC-type branched-subunit amino acid transport system substrate-binding protein
MTIDRTPDAAGADWVTTVPCVPTDKMIHAAQTCVGAYNLYSIWQAMLAAAPPSPPVVTEVTESMLEAACNAWTEEMGLTYYSDKELYAMKLALEAALSNRRAGGDAPPST